MAHPSPPSSLFSDFNLPHGDSEPDTDEERMRLQSLRNSTQDKEEQFQQVEDLEMGFSDDEDDDEAFDRTYASAKLKKAAATPNKSPRREVDDASSSEPRAKRPRPLSLFGGDDGTHSYDDTDDDDVVPKTPGQGLGMHMTSLSLEPQEGPIQGSQDLVADGGEGPSQGIINDAAELDLGDREESPALSEISNKNDGNEYAVETETPAQAYGLRQNIDRSIVPVTWVDIDQSGNYDPSAETKEKALKLQKAKSKRRGKQKAEPKQVKLKKIVRLPIEAMGNVLNITNGEDNWSDGHSIIDTEDEREMKECQTLFRLNTPGVEPQDPIPDPKRALPDLTGHPAARGCTECRRHGQDCSAIGDGHFPCTQCKEDRIECLPIMKVRTYAHGSCKFCEKRGLPCSFVGGDLATICDQCIENDNIDCSPASLASYSRNRMDLDRILYGPDRKHLACTFCRANKKRCSLKEKTDKPPCKYCKRHKIGCTFYDVHPIDLIKKSKSKGKKNVDLASGRGMSRKNGKSALSSVFTMGPDIFDPGDLDDLLAADDKIYEREDTPEVEMEDAQGRTGMVTKIHTSFAHPIRFYAIGDDAPDCNFCEMPVFGFVGHFEKSVSVIRWHSGLGFTELGGGHREEYEATTMCQKCVSARLQVIVCPGHYMQPIGNENAALNFTSAADEFLLAEPRSDQMQHQLQRWCSMCFSLARYKCCALQPSILGQDEDEALLEGCGFRLCDRCENNLCQAFEGNLDLMAAAYDQEPKPGTEGSDAGGDGQGSIRADVGFLNSDGLLMLNVQGSTT